MTNGTKHFYSVKVRMGGAWIFCGTGVVYMPYSWKRRIHARFIQGTRVQGRTYIWSSYPGVTGSRTYIYMLVLSKGHGFKDVRIHARLIPGSRVQGRTYIWSSYPRVTGSRTYIYMLVLSRVTGSRTYVLSTRAAGTTWLNSVWKTF